MSGNWIGVQDMDNGEKVLLKEELEWAKWQIPEMAYVHGEVRSLKNCAAERKETRLVGKMNLRHRSLHRSSKKLYVTESHSSVCFLSICFGFISGWHNTVRFVRRLFATNYSTYYIKIFPDMFLTWALVRQVGNLEPGRNFHFPKCVHVPCHQ